MAVHKKYRITNSVCTYSPTTRTIYLLKTMANTHIWSTIESFRLQPTPLENTILSQLSTQPQITRSKAFTSLHKLLFIHITSLNQLILPNGTHLMNAQNFITYHGPITKSLTNALKLISKLVCQPTCNNDCPLPM